MVVFDFSSAGRINSMGIALLLRSIKSLKMEKGAEISIQGANQINTMLFKMTGIYLLAPETKCL
jgi:anti-anti-sigma regulatory factor